MKLVFILAFLFSTHDLFAAACCGSSPSSSSMILGDLKAQIQLSQTHQANIAQADSSGAIKSLQGKSKDIRNITSLSGAWMFSDPWQLGLNITLLNHTRGSATTEEMSTSLGDTSLTLGHETFPETTWSPYKPRGWSFLRMTLPTGTSTQESSKPLATDAAGEGRYKLHTGVALVKIWNSIDMYNVSEIGLHANTKLNNQKYARRVEVSSDLGIGYSFTDWRIGIATNIIILQGERVDQLKRAPTLVRHNISSSLSYSVNKELIITGNYSDSTWSPLSRHTLLGKSLSLTVARPWLL